MKNISKALAMAVMMSVWCGSAYAAAGDNAYEIGGASATGELSTAVGYGANASNYSSTALGHSATASGESSIALGTSATASEKYSIALGDSAKATAAYSVALGESSVASRERTVSVGGGGNDRQIVHVAAGTEDTDAVNKKQMDAELDKKADKADVEKNAADIADHETRIATLEAGGSGGASTEALEKLDSKINQTNDRVDRVGATAAALAGIHYQPMAKGQSQVAVGMGGYKGKKATALGLAYQISDRISGSVAGAANGSERMFNVGFNYLFGQHSDKDIAQCAAAPGSVSLKEAELQSQVDSLKADNASMKAEIAELKAMVKALAAK